MRKFAIVLLTTAIAFKTVSAEEDVPDNSGREDRVLSVFNVVTFPNAACGASNGYNGTCYTSSECTAKGGTASGTCASSFGVCCVFTISCGGSSSANNSYAIISSYSTSSDSDPCTYTFCKTNSDVCKLRIDFDTMVLSGPSTISSTAVYTDGTRVGDCGTDSLTVSNPGGPKPPTICGYNTGQHMYVPASDGCNQVNIDIDTGSTSTTRKWQIKVTQYECNNMMSPEQDCLQYHTASTGTVLKICLSVFLFMASLKLLPPLFPFLHTFPLSSFFFTISFLFSCFIIPSLSFFSFLTFFSLLSVISSLSSLYCFSPSTSPLYPSFPFFLNSLPFLNYTLF